MTGKATVTEADGPGIRAERAHNRRWQVFGGIYAVLAIGFVVGMHLVRRDPAAGFPPYPPEAGMAAAVLLPLLTIVTMWVGLRMADEFLRRLVVDSWAAAFVATVLGGISWSMLYVGGVVSEPPLRALIGVLLVGSGLAVVVAFLWLKLRRS